MSTEETAPTETGSAPPEPKLDPQSAESSPTPPAEAAPDDVTGLKNALKAEREMRKAAEGRAKELAPYEKAVKDAEEANKSELQKLNEAVAGERDARTKAEVELLRYTVAASKGVAPDMVRFLTGTTKEEVEQAADALLAALGNNKPSMPGRPTERLATGQPSTTNKLDSKSPEELIRMGRGIDAK
jgi:hypothetical protein